MVARCPRSTSWGAMMVNAVSKPVISRAGRSPRRPNMPMRSERQSGLVRAGSAGDGRDGAGEDADVEANGPVFDVMPIEPNDFVEVDDVASPADLPEPSDAGWHRETLKVVGFVVVQIGFKEGPRPDQRHVAGQDVDELR